MNIIYGAGDYGKRLYKILLELGVSIDRFCVSKKTENICLGKEVIDFEELKQLKKIENIFIAIADLNVSRSIKSLLIANFKECVTIYECGPFIALNKKNEKADHFCNICGQYVAKFEEAGIDIELFRKHHVIGGGRRKSALCPACKSLDRHRWLLDVITGHTDIFSDRKKRVLHIAPELCVRQVLECLPSVDYYTGDISPGRAMYVVDITDIQFKDEYFDYIIINHVLEHVVDLHGALSELCRVIKNSGKILMSFPICTDQPTIEDPSVITDRQRLEMYGQEDHVRLFGKDYKEIIEQIGLIVTIHTPQLELSEEEIRKFGLIKDDVILVAERKEEV